MNTLTYHNILNTTNVCNPNETASDQYLHSSLAYLMPRPRRNAQTITQTLEPWTVEGVQGLFFHSGVVS